MLEVLDYRFIDQPTAAEIADMVLDFLSYCKNEAGCQPSLKTTFTE
jgi:hypothetical protein